MRRAFIRKQPAIGCSKSERILQRSVAVELLQRLFIWNGNNQSYTSWYGKYCFAPTNTYSFLLFHHLKWFESSWFGDNPGCLGWFLNPTLPIWRECQSFILFAQAPHVLFQGISSGNITQEFGKLQHSWANHLKIFLHVCWSGFHGKKTTSHRVAGWVLGSWPIFCLVI